MLNQLLAEGLSEEEALKVAAAAVRVRRGQTSIAKTNGGMLQDTRSRVDYGEETAAEAKARWIEQEKADPQGIYSIAGQTASGIFGDSTIATEDYDPAAIGRTLQAHAHMQQIQQVHLQREMLESIKQLHHALPRQLPEEEPPRRRLPQREAPRGKKRR